ncbi:MAG: hypothetical protein NC314_08535 [Roseburia sp.]|nr:hypothetical protein [Roseburia sp.]MCM1242873.1 hypothetical protein [Roseburia sp.]
MMRKGGKKIISLGIMLTVLVCPACAAEENAELEEVTETEEITETEKVTETEEVTGVSDFAEKYIVKDQEYLYSPYSDIGQLGEEGYYFSEVFPSVEETETVVYQTCADVTHDGVEDLVQLSIYAEDTVRVEDFLDGYPGLAYVKVFRGLPEGGYETHPRFISRSYDASHVGNGTICVTHKDGQDYLLLSMIYEMQGEATYDYAVIYIDDEAGIVMEDSADAAFAVWEELHDDWSGQVHRKDVIPAFQRKIEPWIADATILVSFDIDNDRDLCSMEEECPAKVYFDAVWEREW